MTQSRTTQKPIQNYLRAYITALGMTYEQAGEIVGVSPNGLSRPANGERKLQMEIALPLWKAFGFPAEEVGCLYTRPPTVEYFQKHNVEWKGPPPPECSMRSVPVARMRRVEVIGFVQAGVFSEALEWQFSDRYGITCPDDGYPDCLPRYALEVRGESMNRVFSAGSVVCVIDFFDLGREPETGDFVVVHRRDPYGPGMEATIKALQVREDGVICLWPQSTDPNFQQPIILPKRDSGAADCAGAPDVQIKSLVVGMMKTRLKATF